MVTNASLAAALEILATSQATLTDEIATLRRDYATLASLVQASQPTARAKADPMPTGKVTVVPNDPPKGEMVRCSHIKGNGKQCRQRFPVGGACKWPGHGSPKATPKAEVAAPVAPAAPKAPSAGGPYTHTPGITCKGVTKAGTPCGKIFVNGKGYCNSHHTQAKGRSRVAK
jgi:hypothetical protein